MFDWLVDWVYDQLDKVRGWIDSAALSLKSWALRTFAKIGDVVQNVINYFTETYEFIVNHIYNTYQTVSNYITNTYETIVNNITRVYNTVKNYITETYETIVNNITNVIGVTIEKVAEWFVSIGGATREWVEGLLAQASNVWSTITGDLEEWWKTQLYLINETFGWVNDIRDKVFEFFDDPVEFVWARFTNWFLGPEE